MIRALVEATIMRVTTIVLRAAPVAAGRAGEVAGHDESDLVFCDLGA